MIDPRMCRQGQGGAGGTAHATAPHSAGTKVLASCWRQAHADACHFCFNSLLRVVYSASPMVLAGAAYQRDTNGTEP
eukprot:SAG11_NODE_140_length_15009_cov_7.342522_8_plen_77_part_00